MKSLAILSLAAIAASALAQQPTLSVPQRAPAPDYYAMVDAHGRQMGPWIPYLAVGNDFTPNTAVWDAYEADPNGIGNPSDFRDPILLPANIGARYTYNANRPDQYGDFTVAKGQKGQAVQRIHWLARNGVTGPFQQTVRVYDNFNAAPPAGDTQVGAGVIYSWATLTAGFYYFTSDLGALRLRMPADGMGGIRWSLTTDATTGTYSTTAEMGLWIQKTKDSAGNPVYNNGSNGNFQWNDRTAPIGSYNDFANFSEYDNMNFGVFPAPNVNAEPLSFCVGFYNNASIVTSVGTELSGSLASVDTSDDSYYTFFPDEFTLKAEAELTAIVAEPNLTTPELKVDLEYNVARLGLAGAISVLKPIPATWTVVDGFTANATDSTRSVTLAGTNATDHIDASVGNEGQVKIRVTFQPINDEDPAQDGWEHNIDLLTASTNS